MLLERYSCIDFVLNLYWEDGINLINKAIEKRNEQRDWEMWISVYPDMDKKTFVPFEKFRGKKQTPGKPKKELTKAEIIAQAEEIRKLHQGTHEGVAKK